MIAALVDLLGIFYANNDLPNFEVIARSIQTAIPNDLVSLQFLGLVYYRTGRIDEAVSVFERVIRWRNSGAAVQGGETNADISDSDRSSTACMRESTKPDSFLAKAWYDLGAVLLQLRRFDLAISVLRNSLSAEPNSAQATLALGRAGLGAADLDLAHACFSALLQKRPDSGEARIGLGLVYRKRREFAAARACFDRVRALRGGLR